MRIAPRSLQAMGGALGIVVVVCCVLLALRAPALDVRLAADAGPGVLVRAGELPGGTRLLSLAGVPLGPAAVVEEPDTLGSWAAYDAFLELQSRLAAALVPGETVHASDVNGNTWTLAVRAREIGDLPPLFWVQIVVGLLCFYIPFGVWIYRREDPAARHFAVCGLGLIVSACAAAVYSTRGLALDGELIRVLSLLNHLGAKLFAAGLFMLLWHYPGTISPRSPAWLVYGLFAGFWLAFAGQWLPIPPAAYTFEMLMLSASFVCAYVQWRRTRGRPLERAALKWYLLSVYLGTSCFTVAIIIPVLAGLEPLASQGLMFITFLFMFAGIALGVTRYRLFELDRWWFGAWTWFVGGVAVILLDLALVSMLDFSQGGALALSLALLGWVYFPLRQWLWRLLELRRRPDAQARLGGSLERLAAASNDAALRARWLEVLADEFGAAQVLAETGRGAVPRIVENGLGLCMPDGGPGQIRLRLPDGGARLFDRSDEARAEILARLLGHVREAVRERERAVETERARIRRDLHDDLGAKLLSLVYLTDGEARQIAREATQDMREVLSALEAGAAPLGEACAEWEEEARARLASAGRQLRWRAQGLPEQLALSPRQRTNLGRILREAVTNSLKHSQAASLSIALDYREDGGRLVLDVCDDALAVSPDAAPASIAGRAADLGGQARWLERSPGWLRVELPLGAAVPAAGTAPA